MQKLQAVILHRHLLFRDLIELELRDLGPIEIAGSTHDPEVALEWVLQRRSGALVIESTEGFVDRREMLRLFCRAAEEIPQFILISANLATSEIEIVQDSVSQGLHLGGIRPLLHGVMS